MKAFVLATTVLFSGSVFAQADIPADLQNIKICSTEGQKHVVEIEIKGSKVTSKATLGGNVEVKTGVIDDQKLATTEDLLEIETKAKLKEKLTAAAVYAHIEGIDIIAQDATGKKYLLQVLFDKIRLINTTDSCK